MTVADTLELLDWKRRVFALYAEIRASSDPEGAWRLWRSTRDELFRTHPQSPRPGYTDLEYYDYDPAARVLPEPRGAGRTGARAGRRESGGAQSRCSSRPAGGRPSSCAGSR